MYIPVITPIGRFFAKFFKSAPDWTVKVNDVITLIKPLLNTVLTLAAGADNAEAVKKVIAEVQADLTLLGELSKQAQSGADTKDKILAILGSIVDNLNGLLAAGHFKNDKLKSDVSLYVGTIVGEVQAVITVLTNKK